MLTQFGTHIYKKKYHYPGNIQRMATRMIPKLSQLSYEDKKEIELINFKLQKNESKLLKLRENSSSRGNLQNLYKTRPRLDIRK
ncbi:hypothetical protein MAR_001020 [Mya arenaria]|uniref:Ribosomal protein L29 n=1 Tax=Mya arenaria TaxID=6604 RepID=A0ABY7FDT3_MYAAR|nr:hypothetical protein MAR_001020 [Mya arenaria]